MAIFDQFDIAGNIDFSGSYTDNIIGVFSGSGLNNKKFIGSKTQPIYSSSFVGFEARYSDMVSFTFGKYKGKNGHFITVSDGGEIFYDSLMPSPVEYHTANGKNLVMFMDALDNVASLNLPNIPASSSLMIVWSDNDISTVPNEVNDREMLASFPFEKKYANLTRLKSVSNILQKNYNCSYAFGGKNLSISTSSIVALPATASLNVFSNRIMYYHKPKGISGSIFHETNFDCSKTWATTSGFLGSNEKLSGPSYGPSSAATVQQIVPNITDTYKIYFGTSRKHYIRGITNYSAIANDWANFVSLEPDDSTWYLMYKLSIVPAGWKYGVYNGLPTNTNLIFRRGKFGQFRDILEQRPFSKFNLTKKNTIALGPVVVSFISGTNSYVTSTNDLALNSRDSGIYRKEYTSGKPFADDI